LNSSYFASIDPSDFSKSDELHNLPGDPANADLAAKLKADAVG
jgi:hypothetical protein